ncbi:hypothetical protein XA68_12982 [Ophiocordyceps unilateralis]|uniref:Mpv17/PMP22 family protein n=1 Tax=Ophiocordyceps unilateralis TaxID=268505 RepID=A0A2A9PBR6_OPHUN|nr:hypothetical protein XA68_12982 [Ophiocordyceps unilateralis]
MPSPILTATLQAAGLSMASNLCAQFLEAYQNQHAFIPDPRQLCRFLALTFITTPPNYMWQQLLERTFPSHPRVISPLAAEGFELKAAEEATAAAVPPQTMTTTTTTARPLSLRNTATKWFVDCITLGALGNTMAFLILMGLLKGQPGLHIWNNVRSETIPIIIAGYKIWPLASIISFSFVPVHRRVVFLSFVGLLWGVYMSLVAARV